MGQQLILNLSPEDFDYLVKRAQRSLVTPERLAEALIAAARQLAALDPLEASFGAYPSDVPDWAEQHDKYLGEAHLATHNDGGTTGS